MQTDMAFLMRTKLTMMTIMWTTAGCRPNLVQEYTRFKILILQLKNMTFSVTWSYSENACVQLLSVIH